MQPTEALAAETLDLARALIQRESVTPAEVDAASSSPQD